MSIIGTNSQRTIDHFDMIKQSYCSFWPQQVITDGLAALATHRVLGATASSCVKNML